MPREKPGQVEEEKPAAASGGPVDAQEPPARATAYIPPMAAPKESRYHTIDMKAVRLSPDIDPQRMKTQLSLRAIQAAADKPKKSPIGAWALLLLAGGTLGTAAWWLSRWRSAQVEQFVNIPLSNGAGLSSAEGTGSGPKAVDLPAVPATAALVSVAAMVTSPIDADEGSTALGVSAPSVVAPSVSMPTSGRLPTVSEALSGAAGPTAPSPRAHHKSAPRRSAARKVNPPAPNPTADATQVSPSQPKLWLE